MRSKTNKSKFRKRRILKKYQETGSVTGLGSGNLGSGGIDSGYTLGSEGYITDYSSQFDNPYSGSDVSLDTTYQPLEPRSLQEYGADTIGGTTSTPKAQAPPKDSWISRPGTVQQLAGQIGGTAGTIIGGVMTDTSVDDPSGYYNKATLEKLEASNKGMRDSQMTADVGQQVMASAAYVPGPWSLIPLIAGGLITAGGYVGKAVHKGRGDETQEGYAKRVADRERQKKHAKLMGQRNERFKDVNYFNSTGGAGSTAFNETSENLRGKGLLAPEGYKQAYTPSLNRGYKNGGLVKYQTGGTGVTRVYGDYHKNGGIAVDFGEVENKEVLDESPTTKRILKNAGKDSSMYVFSEYLNADGTKGYKDPTKTSIADARMEIENAPISPEQKLALIAELMDKQEKGADRKAKFAKTGGLIKYKTGGIHIKPENVGSLRKALGTPEGKNIPVKDLKIKPGDSAALRKKKTFANNSRKWNKKTGGLVKYRTAGEVPEYDPESAYPTNLEGSNEEIVYRRLRENGIADTAAKAILANIITESDRFKAQEEYAPNKYGTKGYGIAQWTDTKYSNRRKMFNDYMQEKDLDPELLENQVDYLVYEINNHPENMPIGEKMSIETLNSIDNLEEATDYFMKGFEAPKDQSKRHLRKRLKAYEDSVETADLSFTGEPGTTTPPTVINNQRDLEILQSKWGANPQGYTPEDLQSFYEAAQEQDKLQIAAEAAGNPTGSTALAGDFYDEDAGAFRPGMSTADKFYNKYSTQGTDYVPLSLEQQIAAQGQAPVQQPAGQAPQGGLPYPAGYTHEDMLGWYETMIQQDEAQKQAEATGNPTGSTAFAGDYFDEATGTWDPDYRSAQKFYDKYNLQSAGGEGGMTQQPGGAGRSPNLVQNIKGEWVDANTLGPVDFADMRGAVDKPEDPEDPSKRNRGGRLATIGGLTAAQLSLLATADTDYADPVASYRRPRPLRVHAPRLRDTQYAAGVAQRRAYETELGKTTGPTGTRRRDLRQEFDRKTEQRQLGIAAENANRYQWEQGLNVQNLNEYYKQLADAQTLEEASRVSQSNAELMTKLSQREAMSQSLGNVGAGLMGLWGDEDLGRAYQIDGTYDRFRGGEGREQRRARREQRREQRRARRDGR